MRWAGHRVQGKRANASMTLVIAARKRGMSPLDFVDHLHVTGKATKPDLILRHERGDQASVAWHACIRGRYPV